jgi:hypothetical protein
MSGHDEPTAGIMFVSISTMSVVSLSDRVERHNFAHMWA